MSKQDFMNRSIGILGGGQLGRMLYESLTPWDINIDFLDKDKSFPTGKIAPNFSTGDFNNYDDVLKFGTSKDVISIEIENVNTDALLALQKLGKNCYPQPEIIATIKDKGLQKLFYKKHGFPSSDFKLLDNKKLILQSIKDGNIKLPFVQKVRTEGYDGRGVQLINDKDDLNKLWDIPSVIENKVDINKEISIIVARNEHGQVEVFPPVEMVVNPKTNQLDYQICPANITSAIENELFKIAMDIIATWNLIGILAIEFFVCSEGKVYINEVAPRPHNSGHHSIEACNISQFEQLGRALLGLDLIKPKIINPSVMLNLVGSEGHVGKVKYLGLDKCLKSNDIYVHLYGKEITKPNRKMGHITIIDADINKALEKIKFVRQTLKVIAE